MNEPKPRIAGRRVAIGLLLLILSVAGLAIGFWFFGRVPSGPIRAMLPVDAHRALLLREGYRQHDFVHFTLRDVRGGQIWSVPFHDVPREAVPVLAAGRALTWVRNHEGRLEVHAFDLESGRFAFRAGAAFVAPGLVPEVAIVAVGDRVVAVSRIADTRVLVIDARSGRTVTELALEPQPSVPALRVGASGVEIVEAGGIVRRVEPETGAIVVLPPGLAMPAPAPATPPRGVQVIEDGHAIPLLTWAERDGTTWVAAGRTFATIDLARGAVVSTNGPGTVRVRR